MTPKTFANSLVIGELSDKAIRIRALEGLLTGCVVIAGLEFPTHAEFRSFDNEAKEMQINYAKRAIFVHLQNIKDVMLKLLKNRVRDMEEFRWGFDPDSVSLMSMNGSVKNDRANGLDGPANLSPV
ncbi:hypothetical protein KEM56_002332 [Ascosphaera pollenicola]|nr:hypothetical protein KEM56_002332 [Ascosphaera pollenicola]